MAGTFSTGRDLLLDSSGDLVLTSDLSLVDADAAVAQNIRLRMTMWQGEWFRDADLGLPYAQEILGYKPSEQRLYSIFREVIAGSFGVDEIIRLEVDLDKATRVLTVSWEVKTSYGIVADTLEF